MTTPSPTRPCGAAVPRSRAAIDAAAAAVGLPIPEACRSGVEANLELLESHVRRMRAEDGE
ncbi:AtzG-like protein [Novosphingobium mangrovi (ex Hu et al. 2023)]|uniref:DUF4089 domain-containing protein n=1 Tax=Novosphingobium mangrovi (ex Hu et al. 2023) TaxID=2930094 RepID=A0ABT0AEE8_9SPHN|nr:AtzG-like protein [Novosphingobium mangrovi (ex Hu et al. 2023)]MCJ1961556.1 DUF4089 domain-containing protein [Novosphingobium mangrovi (ex Hu et al. 2023)]